MDLISELLTILLTSFGLNLIPFAGPSNLFIASNAAILSTVDPITIGILVALSAAIAKFIHYIITFFLSDHIGEQRRKRLDATAPKFRRWGFIALFIAAATPIPDEPVVIPLGLLKYNPAKFFLAYLAGKLSITIVGAYLGKMGEGLMGTFISPEVFVTLSIILTVVVTIVLLKVDVEEILKKALSRKTRIQE